MKIYPSWFAKVWLINTMRTRYVHCKEGKNGEWEMKWVRQWPRGWGEGVESRWRPALVLPQQPWLRLIHHTDCIALAFCLPQDWSQNLTLHLKIHFSLFFLPFFLFATVLLRLFTFSSHLFSLPLRLVYNPTFNMFFFPHKTLLCWFLTFIFSYCFPNSSPLWIHLVSLIP